MPSWEDVCLSVDPNILGIYFFLFFLVHVYVVIEFEGKTKVASV